MEAKIISNNVMNIHMHAVFHSFLLSCSNINLFKHKIYAKQLPFLKEDDLSYIYFICAVLASQR